MKPNVLVNTWHGTMIVNRFDVLHAPDGRTFGVGHQLLTAGAFDQQEVAFAAELLKAMHRALDRRITAYDIGANIGNRTMLPRRASDPWNCGRTVIRNISDRT